MKMVFPFDACIAASFYHRWEFLFVPRIIRNRVSSRHVVLSRSRIISSHTRLPFSCFRVCRVNDPFLRAIVLCVRDGWNLRINKTQKNIGWKRVDDYHPLASKGAFWRFSQILARTILIHLTLKSTAGIVQFFSFFLQYFPSVFFFRISVCVCVRKRAHATRIELVCCTCWWADMNQPLLFISLILASLL